MRATVADTNAEAGGVRARPVTARHWLLGYFALALPALALAIDSAVAWARGWRVDSRVDVAMLLVAGAWLGGVTLAVAMPWGRKLFARYWAQFIALGASVCLTWLAGELVVGAVLSKIVDPFHCRPAGLKLIIHPRPDVLRGLGPESQVTYNSWGVRGPDPPARDEAYRILCLGGSTTACNFLDDAKTWPRQLARNLARQDLEHAHWVGNAGRPGFRATEHARFVEQSPYMDEIDCLIVQVGINDFMSCLIGPRPRPLWMQSNIRELVRTLGLHLTTDNTVIEDADASVYIRRRARRKAAQIAETEPELTECLRRYRRDLIAIIEACRRHGVRIVFTTQPVLWRADLDAENRALLWFGRLPDGRYLSVDQLRAGMDRYNETLRQVCRDRDVELIELSGLSGDPDNFYDDCHYTEMGTARVARIVADWFAAHPTHDGGVAAR